MVKITAILIFLIRLHKKLKKTQTQKRVKNTREKTLVNSAFNKLGGFLNRPTGRFLRLLPIQGLAFVYFYQVNGNMT